MSATKIIVSYDGTANEEDAVALGRVFAKAGAELILAYVRHGERGPDDPDAETLLARGAELLGDPNVVRKVVNDRSTPEGLRRLAEEESASVIVFCSDSHTAPGSISIGNSAQRLLDGGRFAIAIAPVGLADHEAHIGRVVLVSDETDQAARATAQRLSGAFGAELQEDPDGTDAHLLIVGSRPEAGEGQVALSAAAINLIENATAIVLVVPRAKSIDFDGMALSA
ncbi:MAG TPA: universal stress protein [Solirubrobacteraceae bacterium]|jgi:nucleotide-binding universal stress UspA family protein